MADVELNTRSISVKTAYEANSDTNAFTDAEQTKLAGIESGADVTDSTNVLASLVGEDVVTNSVTTNLLINEQTGTTYTLALSDSSKYVRFDNPADIIVTIPPYASVAFPVGTTITLRQVGNGQVILEEGDSNVLVNTALSLSLRTTGSSATLINVAEDQWDLMGDLE